MFFENREELINVIKSEINSDAVILIKGSRVMKMEQVVNAILEINKKDQDDKGQNKKIRREMI